MSQITAGKLDEFMAPRRGFQDADISLGNIDSTVFHSVSGFRDVMAYASAADLVAAETMTLTLLQASDAAGTGAKVLGTAKIFTAAAGALSPSLLVHEQVEAMDHVNGFSFVGARVTSDGVGVITGEVGIILAGAREKPAI